jgi:squalene cyclase
MANLEIKFKVDPLKFAINLESPIGVYLRREVLKKESKTDAALKNKLHDKIETAQSADGSWNQLFVTTANNLWDLALLGFNGQDASVRRGLEWLLSIQRHLYRGYPGFFNTDNRKDPSLMRSMLYGEFGPGCTIFYETTYAVHLFHIFGFDSNSQVQTTVNSYLQFWRPNWCGAWCNINVLRMLIEHQISKESKQVEDGLRYFARRQTRTGTWKGYPFYHTFHALSRAEQEAAVKQVKKAMPTVIRRQNPDGSWGKSHKEINTFLALDALKNTADMKLS